MPIKKSSKGIGRSEDVPYGLNEVDSFAQRREKILLEDAGLSSQAYEDNEDDNLVVDEEEEEVMSMSDDSSAEEDNVEELDGEKAYKQVFVKRLNLGDEGENEGDAMLDNDNAWGSSKNEYYGADDLDDEETAKEIENEARRQQKKHLESLNMNDYLDDEVNEEWAKSAKEFDLGQFQESVKQQQGSFSVKDVFGMGPDAKESFLKTSFPEFFPLSEELVSLAPILEELKAKGSNEFVKVKIRALTSYLGVISSYFAIFLHELQNNDDFQNMKDHAIMEAILTCKEIWRQASELPEDVDVLESEEKQDEEQEEYGEVSDVEQLDEELLQESDAESLNSAAEEEANEIVGGSEEESGDFDIDISKPRVSKKSHDKNRLTEVDDYVESEIADVDAQEKKARRKTLRFYTSKIDQQENKKTDRFKGDDDIPYKERLYERQQRLLEEARKRGQRESAGADLDSNEYGSEDESIAKAINKDSESDYYNQIQRQTLSKRESRKQAHKDALLAARSGKLAELAEEIGDDHKRAINYQILKNKGLTPKRKKDNRNSRVKKRKKFEKAQKKLKSVRAVYSGQSGPYEGEKTGIKKNLAKSVKFRS